MGNNEKASRDFKDSVAVSTNAINTVCINFFAQWSVSLKIGHYHVFETTSVALTRFKFARFRI